MEVATRPLVRRWGFGEFSVQDVTYPPLYRMTPHTDGKCRVGVLIAGSVEEMSGGVAHWSVPGSMVIKPGAVVHANRFGVFGARVLSVTLDAGFLEEVSGQPVLSASKYGWCHSTTAGTHLTHVLQQVIAWPNRRILAGVRHCLHNLLARLTVGRNKALPPSWLTEVGARLRSDPARPPSVRWLAQDAGVHAVYFARAFRRHYACTVGDYVRRQRILNAAELLRNSHLPLAHIAVEVGFADQPHFCRQFRRETGLTPLNYQRSVRRQQVAFVQSNPTHGG